MQLSDTAAINDTRHLPHSSSH